MHEQFTGADRLCDEPQMLDAVHEVTVQVEFMPTVAT